MDSVYVGIASILVTVVGGVVMSAYTFGQTTATKKEIADLSKKMDGSTKEVWDRITHIQDHYARRDDLKEAIADLRATIHRMDQNIMRLIGTKE
jgi:phage host-nuclease inhibitor protein Gam